MICGTLLLKSTRLFTTKWEKTQKYNWGKGTIVDVLDSQSALLDSHTNYYRALADYNTALSQFHLAVGDCLLYTSPSPRDRTRSRMPSSA